MFAPERRRTGLGWTGTCRRKSAWRRCQEIAGREAKAEGVDLAWAPMCDLARDPRWGRVVDTALLVD